MNKIPLKENLDFDLSKRPDISYIANLVQQGQRVLDLGCGNGELMVILKSKGVKVQGIEKDDSCIIQCVKRGLYVHHGDIDDGLQHHLDKSFDYVILNQTIQQTLNPGAIIKECLRIGKKVVIVFPNFSHWQIRLSILISGKTPVTDLMPFHWYDTPNLHYLSTKDFADFCEYEKIKVLKRAFFNHKREIKALPNLFATLALFVIQAQN
ncbi:methionine biosynthesis protein MetW [Leptospira idonii]|uniref:Methionine biosynthesis protein MetW n=1 Tax=Leptospira idonii TaxID=1193500 RepID=A0A4R9M150_9LEPT|nr:methionine biosynthesis protein MetW [Leptospira idonii]TGN18458.1 methionine biosynthesis protein MetW [Leptospira idonii]